MKQPKPKNKQSLTDNGISHINPLIKEALIELEVAANTPDGLSGLKSGFRDLDKITAGWQNGDLIVIAARPAMGKTAFITSMVKNMAVDENIPIGIFSLELTNTQIVNRFIVNVCEIPGERIKNGMLASYEWEQLDFKIKELSDSPIYIDDSHTMLIQTLCEKAREMVNSNGIQAIFIDYIQLLSVVDKYSDSRYNEMNYISRSLKALAKELNIPIFAISQMNRNIENRTGVEGKRPQLTDLRDSGTICDDADIVCFIHRPEYYKILEDEKGNSLIGLAEIIIAKHRNGTTGDVLLRFKSEFARFSNIDDDSDFGNSNNFTSITIDPNAPVPF